MTTTPTPDIDAAAARAATDSAAADRFELLLAAALVCNDDELDAITAHVRTVPFDPAKVDQLPAHIAQLISNR